MMFGAYAVRLPYHTWPFMMAFDMNKNDSLIVQIVGVHSKMR